MPPGAKLPILIIAAILTVSCRNPELDRALRELDEEIECRDHYASRIEASANEIKISCIFTPDDSLRWEQIHGLVEIYRAFNLDSMSRYIDLEKRYASNDEQILYTEFDSIYENAFRGNGKKAFEAYGRIPASSLSDEHYNEYLRLGIEIFKHEATPPPLLEKIRKELLTRDTSSYIGIENRVRHLKQQGKYEQAQELFFRYIAENEDSDRAAAALYNIATIYERTGDRKNMELYMTKSAIADIRGGHRAFLSLYRLAMFMLEDRDYARASRYINVHYEVISEGYFYPRIQISGEAAREISEEYIRSQKRMHWILSGAVIIILFFTIITRILLRRNREKSRKLELTNNELLETQKKLRMTGKIKESYVSRYMMLARHYLGQLSEQRIEYKRTLKENGPDELYRKLKQVDRDYKEEKEFYRIFDEAFLGIFPDFVHQVNSLIKPEYAFDEGSHILPTEIRILAVIKLGITSSADIAAFLNCSLNTVYTYRGKIRSISIVEKNRIEEIIAGINS